MLNFISILILIIHSLFKHSHFSIISSFCISNFLLNFFVHIIIFIILLGSIIIILHGLIILLIHCLITDFIILGLHKAFIIIILLMRWMTHSFRSLLMEGVNIFCITHCITFKISCNKSTTMVLGWGFILFLWRRDLWLENCFLYLGRKRRWNIFFFNNFLDKLIKVINFLLNIILHGAKFTNF